MTPTARNPPSTSRASLQTQPSACGIELDGRDELDAVGIAEPWPLEDVDERDFFGGDEEW